MEKKKTTSKKTTKPVVKKTTSKKKNAGKKRKIAFTLIELLAVIVILGILLLVAIPSVTTYINNSRKETYIDTVHNIIKGATNLVNSGELNMFDIDTTYYIPSKCIKLETGGNSPYGDFDPAYIAVTYDNNSFNYYWISRDSSGIGIKEPTPVDELTSRSLEANLKIEDIKMISLEGKTKILVIDENDCHTMNEVEEERKIDYINRKEAGKISFKDEVAIDTEHFTVLSSNDEKTILVAKSNLYVGEIWNMNYSTRVWTKTKTLTPEDEGYGLQNVDARGYVTGSYVNIGSVPFSASNYWDIDECHCGSSGLTCSSTNDSGFNNQHGLKPEYEVTGGYRTLKANVYNSSMSTAAPSFEGTCTPNNGYTIAYYVEAYVRKLKEMGAPTSITGRLLTNDEALVYLDGGLSGASYWTQTARGYYAMIVVFARYGRDLNLYPYFYGRSNYGVRVVLEVPTSTLS